MLFIASFHASADVIDRAVVGQNVVPFRGERLSVFWTQSGQWATVTQEFADGHGRSRVEYLSPHNLRGHVLIFDGQFHWHIIPQQRVLIRSTVIPSTENRQARLALLRRNYDVRISRRQYRVEGVNCHLVELRPRSRCKLTQKMWIDPCTGFVLKVERYRADGALASISHFLSVVFGGVLDRGLFEVHPQSSEKVVCLAKCAALTSVNDMRSKCGSKTLVPLNLPGGFVLENACLMTDGDGNSQLLLHYTDGLVTISLVQMEPRPQPFWTFPFFLRRAPLLATSRQGIGSAGGLVSSVGW